MNVSICVFYENKFLPIEILEILHGNNFSDFPVLAAKHRQGKKIKLFKYVTFEPQVIQRGAMQRK